MTFFFAFFFFFIFRIFYDTCLPRQKIQKLTIHGSKGMSDGNDQSMNFPVFTRHSQNTETKTGKKNKQKWRSKSFPFRNAIGSFWLRQIDQDHYSRYSNEIRVVIASLVSEKYNVCLLRFFGNLALWYLRNRWCMSQIQGFAWMDSYFMHSKLPLRNASCLK
jgi:hypothetical protein